MPPAAGRARAASPRRRGARGLTLIELMVVMLIIVVLVVAGAVTLGQMRGADADTTANVIAGAMRYVSTLAVHENRTYRLVLDMDQHRWWVEAANEDDPCSRFVDRADPPSETPAEGEGAVADAEEIDVEDALGEAMPGIGATSFSEQENRLLKGEFEPETTVSGVLTEHHSEAQTSGRVAIYFYPNGSVERAFVWVAEETEDDGQVKVDPEITLRLESLGQVLRLTEVLSESDFDRSDSEARL